MSCCLRADLTMCTVTSVSRAIRTRGNVRQHGACGYAAAVRPLPGPKGRGPGPSGPSTRTQIRPTTSGQLGGTTKAGHGKQRSAEGMAKKDGAIEIEGTVVESLPNAFFRVE